MSAHPPSRLDFTGLRPHQVEHAPRLARCLLLNRGALDASDTGTGKAFVASWITRTFKTTALVICPKSVKADWAVAMRHMGAQAEIVNYERARGYHQDGAEMSSSQWGYEQACGQGSRWVWNSAYELVIFDEVDRCGGETSLNSKMLIAAVRQASFVLGLSATAAEDPRQLKALGFALRLFKLSDFRYWLMAHGCRPSIWGGFDFLGLSNKPKTREQGQKAMLKIHNDIFNGGRGARMRKSEIPGFPKTQIEYKLIDDESGQAEGLTEELAEVYGHGRDLERLTALRQELELLKVPHLVELAEHYAKTSRVLIFVNYRRTAELLLENVKKLFHGDQCLTQRWVIDGQNTEEEREHLKKAFQANQIPVLICNVQAGGIGIGLHDPKGRVERTSLISPCYSARVLEQVFGRPNRDGAAFSLQLLLAFANTLEEQIARVVLRKRENLQAFNDAILNGQLPPDLNTTH